MIYDVIILIVSLIIILIGAEVFTNSVEWLGKKLNLGAGAVGSIFAAVGTAMPETMVPVIAILGSGGGGAGHDVGIGAILGAPFMLATLAMCVTGVAAFVKRKNNSEMHIIPEIMKRDMRFFIMVYTVAILATFLPLHSLKVAVAIFLCLAYFYYAYQTVRHSIGGQADGDELAPLYLARKKNEPHFAIVVFQLALALAIIISGAHMFVGSVEVVAVAMSVPVLVLSLIITPVATELPEKFNSIIWVSRGKDTLALGNITGAMVFQSSLLPALGILMTEWALEPLALLSAALALIAVVYQYSGLFNKHHGLRPSHLIAGGFFYAVFIAVVVTGIL